VLAVSFPAELFATNCYVLATERGADCVVVDPGIGVLDTLGEVLRAYDLKPAAVLLTHGHLDHVYSVTPVCGSELAAFVHTDDRYRLKDPISLLSPEIVGMFEQQYGARSTWSEPTNVVEIGDREALTVAGLELTVRHAPGHTEGSVIFELPGVPEGVDADVALDRTVVSGDVLFKGSIGRTDLAGGSHEAMQRSLRDVVLPLPDSALVLPGHGPATTMGAERTSNPYLQGLSAPR
jgi:glyoxylase-like metal-dependent hydrolase (beta-lactamase superfamily II)